MFKFLETSGTHLWDYVRAIVKYRQCLAHSLHQNACSANINSFSIINKHSVYRDYLSSTYTWKISVKGGEKARSSMAKHASIFLLITKNPDTPLNSANTFPSHPQ